jgi:hypothetical protein
VTFAPLLLALAAGLPPSADGRWRVELAGEHVGWASLEVRCGAATCRTTWRSGLRAPEEAGAAILSRTIEAEVLPDGAAIRVHAVVEGDRGSRETSAGAGPVPASLAELLLSSTADGERRCVRVRDEVTGEVGEACAARRGAWIDGEALGVPLRYRAEPGAAPDEVVVPSQGVRFVADANAALPASAPRLHGSAVAHAPGADAAPPSALRFCGLAPEPPALAPTRRLPPPRAAGASCREKTARWLAAAAQAGLRGRHVAGVAWAGSGFAWHEWAEVFADGAWTPVDPSFRQLPARGPRFAIARFAPGDEAARAAAGRRILSCWGKGRVERVR